MLLGEMSKKIKKDTKSQESTHVQNKKLFSADLTSEESNGFCTQTNIKLIDFFCGAELLTSDIKITRLSCFGLWR